MSNAPNPDLENISASTANTNIINFNGLLLALNESASPVEIDMLSLKTLGDYTFENQINTSFTAHPRYDYRTKELLAFSYINDDGDLRYYRINCNNKVVANNIIRWPYQAMMHDFSLIHAMFMSLEMHMNLERQPLLMECLLAYARLCQTKMGM